MWDLIVGFLASYGLICAVRQISESVVKHDLHNKLLGYVPNFEVDDDLKVKATTKKKA